MGWWLWLAPTQPPDEQYLGGSGEWANIWWLPLQKAEMCSERDSPLKRLYRQTHAKLARLAGSGQLVWAAGCELSLALVHARRPAWTDETFETILRVAPPSKTRPPNHSRVNWPVDASASGSAQVGATDEPREFRLAGSRQDKRLERAILLTTYLCKRQLPRAIWLMGCSSYVCNVCIEIDFVFYQFLITV